MGNKLGEFGFIQEIKKQFSLDLPEGVEGIGDDCAIIPETDQHSLLVTTDMLIEDIHFLRSGILSQDLGYKSLAVNISDIAAMGGIPQFAFLSLAFPLDLENAWLESFISGFKDLASSTKIHLLGGDTNQSSHGITINVTLLGRIENKFIKRRSEAKQGDIVCVTDFLGDSAGGLKYILEKLPRDTDGHHLVKRHDRPQLALQEGQWLSRQTAVHAMMDVSDGIDSDLKRIMESSKCGVQIKIEDIPLSAALQRSAKVHGFDFLPLALAGGEDYCLLLTVDPSAYEELNKNFQLEFSHSLYQIGTIVEKELTYLKNGVPLKVKKKGFDHFRKADGH
jgi:thiamine-monophosphate kinase